MALDAKLRCTGPYTRIPFTRNDLKPTQTLLDGLARIERPLRVRDRPSGEGGTNDFNLHIDIDDTTSPVTIWDVRAAKFLGLKKLFGRAHVYEIAIRKRDEHNAITWEAYLFAENYKTLAQRFPSDLRCLMKGENVNDLVPADRAHAQRIRLCTVE